MMINMANFPRPLLQRPQALLAAAARAFAWLLRVSWLM